MGATKSRLGQFAKSLCDNFGQLQANGHPKWKEVSLAMPQFGPGLELLRPDRTRTGPLRTKAPPSRSRSAPPSRRILGLCEP